MKKLLRQGSCATLSATDELGYTAVENPVHVNDRHATMLFLFGIEHPPTAWVPGLTDRFQGRDFRLTDMGGHVDPVILA